ncbi:MAG: YihA family ribosome biogenesis GTP-binding protein [Eubacterium sp.]|nr:YihA family ribosome biogenesis GTP-binding protein [Eubacterium sp.]
MKIKSVSLDIVCGPTSVLPDTGKPEVAFAGKSNVGKSSMINAVINRKALARTSSQPGKTQTINFYHVNNDFYLVDLPGYGYAAASQKAREAWGKMIERYLHTSPNLRSVFLLLDIRHAPSRNDRMMYDWIVDNGYQPIIIATKLDKIKRSQVQKQVKILRETLDMPKDAKIIPFSALTKQGKDEIHDAIAAAVRDQEADEEAPDASPEKNAADQKEL